MKNNIFLSLLLLAGFAAMAQRPTSEELIKEGIRLYGEGDYEKAIETYRLVHENDSNYTWMLGELALTFIQTGDYDSTVYYANKALAEPTNQRQHLLRTKGTALDQMGETDKAIETYLEAIRSYPYAYMLRFNLGVTYMQNENYPAAVEQFQHSLECNPFHASSHLLLGLIMGRQGHFTRAIMAFQTFLAIEPNSERSNEVLVWVENLCSNYQDPSMGDPIEPFTDNAVFDEVDHLLKARVVLNERYPSPISFDANLVKQTSMLLETLPLDSESDDFWIKMYFPFYKTIRDQDFIEPFLFTILTSTGRDEVIEYHEKRSNQKVRKDFFATGSALDRIRSKRNIEKDGQILTLAADYYEDGNLHSLGNIDENGKEYGPWFYFYANGEPLSEGQYEEGNREGRWTYWHDNGLISSTEHFQNGMLQGELTGYHYEVPAMSIRANFENNEIDGLATWYSIFETKEKEYTFENGIANGPARTYYATSQPMGKFTLVDDMVHGEYITYHLNGQPVIISHYRNDTLDGEYTEYYSDGTLSMKSSYREGLEHGDWVLYHPNGKVRLEKSFFEGKPTGVLREYHHNGVLNVERHFNDNGEVHGKTITFDHRGNKINEEEFVNGLIVSVVSGYNSPEGAKTYGNAEGTFSFTTYYACGAPLMHGQFEKGKSTGTWEKFYRNGNIESVFLYEDDLLEGETKSFFPDGKIKSVSMYEQGKLHGRAETWYADGTLESSGYYKNDIQDYLWYLYYPSGQLNSTSYFLEGAIHGWLKSWAIDGKKRSHMKLIKGALIHQTLFGPDGQVTQDSNFLQDAAFRISYANGHILGESTIVGGQYQGTFTWYHPNGNIFSVHDMLGGMDAGEYKRYDPEGNLNATGQFFDNYRHGLWTRYFEDGNVKSVSNYYLDDLDSTQVEYYTNGSKRLVENYFLGKLDGDVLIYEPGGELMVKIIYATDEIVGYQYMQQGHLSDTIAITSHDQVMKAFYDNGNLSFEQHFHNFVPHGPRIKYYPGGDVMEHREYHDGLLEGVSEKFYPDGKPEEKFTCVKNLYQGEYTTWWPNGNKKKVVTYLNDEQHGPTSYFDENGNLLRVENYWSDSFVGFIEQ
ncbi:MAG: tetratricopeptide repeat protein [Bacteroidota bacterium]